MHYVVQGWYIQYQFTSLTSVFWIGFGWWAVLLFKWKTAVWFFYLSPYLKLLGPSAHFTIGIRSIVRASSLVRLHYRLCRNGGSWPKSEKPHTVPQLTLQRAIGSSSCLEWRKLKKATGTFPLLLIINSEDLDPIPYRNFSTSARPGLYSKGISLQIKWYRL